MMQLLSEKQIPHRGDVAAVLSSPSWALMRDMPTQAWFPLHWRLLALGWYSEAYHAKRCLAEWVVHRTSKRKRRSIAHTLKAIQALAFLDRIEDGVSLSRRTAAPRQGGGAHQTFLAGVQADLSLLLGDVEPLQRELSSMRRSSSSVAADLRFAEYVAGSRVAIVGPAATQHANGDEIDDFDIVVRTSYPDEDQLPVEKFGSRTDIIYPALGRSVLSIDDLSRAVGEGSLQMVVMRSLRHRSAHGLDRLLGKALRVNPREYLGSFVAAQFAIQRIIHDVIRFRPAEVKIFNTTLFVDAQGVYFDGYSKDVVAARDRQGLVAPPRAFAHDYLADFTFTKRLHDAGHVEVDKALSNVLTLSPEEYLAALDAQS